MEECSDDFNGGVCVAEVFDDVVVPFEKHFASGGGVSGSVVLDVVENDEGWAPLVV